MSSPRVSEAARQLALLAPPTCESEPIHSPGSIQSFGVLIVASRLTRRIVYVSANCEEVTRVPPETLLGSPLAEWLGKSNYAKLAQGELNGDPSAWTRQHYAATLDDGRRYHFAQKPVDDLLFLEIEPEAAEPDGERVVSKAQMVIDAIKSSTSLAGLLATTADQIRELTGYDRVMVYRFDDAANGEVVAENCAPEMTPYLGLHYPASDIPSQARSLYLRQRVRAIPDVDQDQVPVVGFSGALALDMTYCDLRSISPIHLEYLRNMGVRASMSLSLISGDKLWGLIACHHREAKLPSLSMRSSCDLVSQIVSFLIGRQLELDEVREQERQKQRMERISATLSQHDLVIEGLLACKDLLLEMVGASGALLCFDGRRECIGITPGLEEAARLILRLRLQGSDKIYSTDFLSDVLPDTEPLRDTACGVLLMSTLRHPGEGILWFRPELLRTVNWAGNPDKSSEVDAETGLISPRKSFAEWRTQVELHSQPWKESEFDAALSLKRTLATYLLGLAERAFSKSILFDNLTMLPNRRYFQEKIRAWTERKEAETAAVVLINLDRFKLVNEAFGHNAGDDLLQQAARRLTKVAHGEIFLARLGGDEFAALCLGMPRLAVEQFAEAVAQSIAVPFKIFGKPFRIMASLGVAYAAHGGESEMLRAADTALHFAKRSGRNQSVAFDKVQQQSAIQSIELEQDLYRALEEKQLRLVYQPLVTLKDSKLYGFEALLRWQHPTKGMIPPLDFIPLAEETGLIVPIGEWVLEEAIRTVKQWNQSFGQDLTLHVNVAGQQLMEPDFVKSVTQALVRHAMRPETLSIEVTESVLMRAIAVETLRDLRRSGVRVSVDDFGTGYSSLAYLKNLPVDIVKIDRSFIREIATDGKSREFCGAILDLLRPLGLEAVAEGIETSEQREMLLASGCAKAQGFFFSRPLDAKAAAAFLKRCCGNSWEIPTE